jgi:Tfp pilus assembly protein PilO
MNEKKPLIIACAVLAFIIIAGGSALYYFHFVVLPKSQAALDAARKAVAEAKEKKNKIKELVANIDRLKAEEAEKKSRIPNLDAKEYDGLANLLDDIRKRAGVDVSKGTFQRPRAEAAGKGAPVAAGNVHKVQYDMGVKGAFHQLVRYLNLLEKEKRFINVESFTIGRGTDAAVRGKSVAQAVRDLKIVVSSYTWRHGPTGAATPAVVSVEEKGGVSTPVPE